MPRNVAPPAQVAQPSPRKKRVRRFRHAAYPRERGCRVWGLGRWCFRGLSSICRRVGVVLLGVVGWCCLGCTAGVGVHHGGCGSWPARYRVYRLIRRVSSRGRVDPMAGSSETRRARGCHPGERRRWEVAGSSPARGTKLLDRVAAATAVAQMGREPGQSGSPGQIGSHPVAVVWWDESAGSSPARR